LTEKENETGNTYYDDETKQDEGAVFTKHIDQDLKNRLFIYGFQGGLEVLDREEEG
jgi:hypothetical protein